MSRLQNVHINARRHACEKSKFFMFIGFNTKIFNRIVLFRSKFNPFLSEILIVLSSNCHLIRRIYSDSNVITHFVDVESCFVSCLSFFEENFVFLSLPILVLFSDNCKDIFEKKL